MAEIFQFTRGSLLGWVHHRWKTAFTTNLPFARRVIYLLSARTRKVCGSKYFIPVRGSKLLSPKKGKKRDKKGQKALDFCLSAIFLKLRTTDLGCKSLTLFSGRTFKLPKRLRVSALTTFSCGNLRALTSTQHQIIRDLRAVKPVRPTYTNCYIYCLPQTRALQGALDSAYPLTTSHIWYIYRT